ELRTDSRLLTVRLQPVLTSRYSKWSLSYALLDVDQTFYGFSSTAGNPFDVGHGPSLQGGRHRIGLTWRSVPIHDLVYVSTTLQLQSGARYTPRIAGDVNGDGASNDLPFLPDVNGDVASGDSTLAAGIRSLLTTGSASARECLARQLGAFAARGSCQGPWT